MSDRKPLLGVTVAALFTLLAFPFAPRAVAQTGCPGGTTSALAPQFPNNTSNISDHVWTGDTWIYALSTYGFTRTNIVNPDLPGPAQLAQVGYDRGNPDRQGGGGKVVVDCDCHNGGTTMGVAENLSTGDSRVISDWQPYYENGAASMPLQAARGIGATFDFAQQIHAGPVSVGAPIAAIYLPSSGKYIGYFPTASFVQAVDLTNTTGLTGQTCPQPGPSSCYSDPAQALQPLPTTLPWQVVAVWAGQAVVGGQLQYILVGAGTALNVALINPATGVPTSIGSVPYTVFPDQIAIATVKGGAYIFSAEETVGGLQVYEIRPNYTIVPVTQPAAFAGRRITRVVVKGSPGSSTPLIFAHREGSPTSFIDIYDTSWLTPGVVNSGISPRLGASVPHLGNSPGGYLVRARSFGAKVAQVGSTVYAYVFEVVNTSPQLSFASTRKDVSCIAADPTAPPAASFLTTNLTAQAQNRVGTNYYGDRWTIQDTTSTGVPLTGLEWDLIAPDQSTSSLAPDASVSFPGPGTVPANVSTLTNIIWPCDPAVAGTPATGSACFSSLGGATAGASNSHFLKNRSTNPNPPPSIFAAGQTVQKPTVYVNGQTGTGVTVQVLTGAGVLDALANPRTQGNTAEASFQWLFFGCASCSPAVAVGLTSVNVPTGATSFSLSVQYKDGYTAALVSGTIQQRDLIPGFTLAPATVLTGVQGGQLTLTNTMQKAPSATVNFVNYSISGPVPSGGSLSGTFNVANGTAQVTAPNTVGSYTITLTYNYNGPTDGVNQNQTTPPQSFTVTTWSPTPAVTVYADAAGTINVNQGFGNNLVVNTTYYLKDSESVPSGITHPGAQFFYNLGGGETSAGSTPAGTPQPTVPFTPAALCSTGCYVKVSVQGATNQASVTVGSATQPLSVSVNGPTSGAVSTVLQYSANATGGKPPYSYFWDCDVQFTANFQPGSAVKACSYSTAGQHYVQVSIVDSASTPTVSSLFPVVIGGGGGGQLAVTISGPSTAVRGTPVTFTAQGSGGAGGYTYAWKPGEVPNFEVFQSTGSNPNFSYTYVAPSTYTVTCQITSGSSTKQGTRTITITPPLGPPAPTAAYTVSGASLNPLNGTYEAEGGQTITFSATEVPTNVAPNGYAWDFADGSPRYGQQVAYSFPGAGSKTVSLSVTGDGTNRSGTASAAIHFTVHPPSFQAILVPTAEHSAVFTDYDGKQKFWATDVSLSNPGTAPVTISPAFLDFLGTIGNFQFDLSTVAFDPAKRFELAPKATWSAVDVVKVLNGDTANKGTLIFKYEGGDATPLVTSRVYFASADDPLGPSAGAAVPGVRATKDGQVLPQSGQLAVEQSLPGLRGDSAYDFRLSLFNSVGLAGMFRLTVLDQDGNPVTMKDPREGGAPATYLDFAIGPYQGVDWSSDDLGLNDPTKRYVLKARKAPGFTTGRLLPFAALRDRITRDEMVIAPDGPPEFREPCAGSQSCVNYVVPGASRYPTPAGAQWKTGLTIYNPSTMTRGIGLTYSYSPTSLQPPEQTAQGFYILGPGKLVFWDDIVAQVFATPDNHLAELTNGTAGVVRIQHFADPETTTAPLLISARNYDDQPTGTVGSQLFAYTRPISIGPGEAPLMLTGLQQDDATNPKPRFTSTVNVFAYDDVLTVVRLTALKSDGTELGRHHVALNNPGASGHFQPRSLGASDATGSLYGVRNEPISVKIEVVEGGRVGAYGMIEDLTTRDPTYVQALPQN